jgi:two-component system sensor histidine kinase MtrB
MAAEKPRPPADLPPLRKVPLRDLPIRLERAVHWRVRKLYRGIRRRWSRSLRLRVIATTMLLGLVVVFGVGDFLLHRIRDGLISSRETSAMIEAEELTNTAKQQFQGSEYKDADGEQLFVNDLMATLSGPSGGDESWGVILERALKSTEQSDLRTSFTKVSPSVIPQSLRVAVNTHTRQQAQITSVPSETGDDTRTPALAVGSVIDVPLSGPYELYFVYPLPQQQQILDLVERTFYVGGIALVLLVGGVAYVVTRQVVTPVRLAAQTAEELASGRLDRRMRVKGQDDLARLGRAFNGMAAGLERQIHQLEELSRVQRRFVSDVSHELRTPLTTIRMASEVIHEGRHDFDPVLARSAELLQTQLDRFESLLTDLLEISRFDAGAAVLDVEAVDVREVVDRVVEALAPLAERKGSQILLQMPLEPCLAQIDSRRVERIIRNLVGNAIEHSERRPIEAQVAGSPDAVAVVIRDHGVGIDVDELGMVFNRFWRADPARARTTGGTGLGLAIAQEDAHLHGGWLQAWGQPGVGAVFRLTLPREAGGVLVSSPLTLVPRHGDSGPDTGSVTIAGSGGLRTLPPDDDLDSLDASGTGAVAGEGPDGATGEIGDGGGGGDEASVTGDLRSPGPLGRRG